MLADFWHHKWQVGEIGFHEGQVNHLLSKYLDQLNLTVRSRIFLPLCGKTRDIAWLLSKGYRVVGAELNPIAVSQLFEELAVQAEIVEVGPLTHYRTEGLDIFLGDVFDLNRETLGAVNAIYDRAAMVALPEEMRSRYAGLLVDVCAAVPQLLISFEYDQSALPGPPFSVPEDELRALYQPIYQFSCAERFRLPGGLKGKVDAEEIAWVLRPA